MADAATVAQLLANGLVHGSILALGAIGLTLVYGILKLANFAHADMMAFGAFAGLFFGAAPWPGREVLAPAALVAGAVVLAAVAVDLRWGRRLSRGERAFVLAFGGALLAGGLVLAILGTGAEGTTTPVLVVALLLGVGVTTLASLGLEGALWRPLRRRGATLLTMVIVSVGLSFVIRNGLTLYFGAGTRSFDRPIPVSDAFGPILLSDAQQLTLVLTVVLAFALHLLLTRTRTGKAMRALADDMDLARVSGIDVDRVVVHVWALGGALIAVAGLLLSFVNHYRMDVNMGVTLILPLFAAVILGGVGSVHGALLGGLVVGVAMKTSALWIGTQYELAAAFVILIAVLVWRPQGLLGVRS